MNQPLSFNMQHKQQQSLKQMQRLIMSPQMQQALHLLQMPVMELAAVISAELEQNPVLEYENEHIDGDETWEEERESANPEEEMDFEKTDFEILKQLGDEFGEYYLENESVKPYRTEEESSLQNFLESSIQKPESLFNHLMDQAKDSFDNTNDLDLSELIIGNLDEKGFLTTPLSEIALLNDKNEKRLSQILSVIQTFSPAGIGAVSLQESLLLQLQRKKLEKTLAYLIVKQHFDDMLHNRIPLIKKGLKCSPEEIQDSISQVIAKLDLHPGITFSPSPNHAILPDVVLKIDQGQIEIFINEESIPGLKINRKYLKMLEDETTSQSTQEYIRTKISSGKWLMKNIHQRNDTLRRIVEFIVKAQRKFFIQPEGKLNPMTMKSIAKELEIHESTVARACANKYIACPKGLFTLRSFFTNAYTTETGDDISASTVKELVLKIIGEENKQKPLSDEAISKLVQEQGISCARRTVAKYRYELGIGNTTQRRKFA